MNLKEYYKDKTVIVTGHTGFKGSWLSLWLNILGAKVIGLSDKVYTNPSHYEIIKDIFRLGIPASLSMIIMSMGILLFNWYLNVSKKLCMILARFRKPPWFPTGAMNTIRLLSNTSSGKY